MQQKIKCKNCNSSNIIKKGIKKKKLQSIQRYFCKDCGSIFTLSTAKSTYPIQTILKAVSLYNLGYNLGQVSKVTKSRNKIEVPTSTISSWLNQHKSICTFARLRNQAVKLYSPKEIIKKQTLNHIQPYTFKYHKAKLELLFKNKLYNNQFTNLSKFYQPLKNYLEKIPTNKFPHHIFKQNQGCPNAVIAKIKNIDNKNNEQRASKLKFNHLKITHLSKNNLANKLTSLALNLAKSNKQRHEAVQNFMLINDSTTIATEIPVYLTQDDITYFISRKFTLPLENQPTPITGHIDILQVRNGLIHILDYKPEAKTQSPIEQLTIYALAVASKTKLALSDFKCAWFDFNETGYKLIFEINNTVLYLDSVEYSIVEETANEPPVLVKNISDIEIIKNRNYSINLSEYFYDEDVLSYSAYKADNLTVVIEDNTAVIIPDHDFVGVRYMFFKANDSLLVAVSNVFAVNVSEVKELEQLKAEINKPVKWVKRSSNKNISIPSYAFNLSINKIINNKKSIINKEKIKKKEITIEEDADSYEVEYETKAPKAVEKKINEHKKQITISSDISYTDVLAYTFIVESPKEAIKLYWYIDGVKIDVTFDKEVNLRFVDSDNDDLVDRLEWNVPHLSEQVFEVSITVLNVQSYPTVGGEWTVRFETSGVGNLSISAVDGTTWSNVNEDNDLKFLEIKCGSEVLDYSWTGSSVFIEDYSCQDVGEHTVKVLTEGIHNQRFNFSNVIADAHNFAVAGGIWPTTHTIYSDFSQGVFTNGSYANDTAVKLTENKEPDYATADENGLVLWMKFNNESSVGEDYAAGPGELTGINATSVVYDYSNSENNGTFYNNQEKWKSDCQVGNCLSFDGSDDYVDAGNEDIIKKLDVFTLTAWIKTPSSTDYKEILNKKAGGYNGFEFKVYNDHKLRFQLYENDTSEDITSGDSVVDDNNWHHVAVVYPSNGTRSKIYLDGVRDNADGAGLTNYTTTNSPLVIGRRQEGSDHYFNGTIDEVHIYNRSLSAEEVNWSYLRGLSGLKSNVSTNGSVLYIPFNESSGNKSVDYSNTTGGAITSANNGTLYGYDSPIVYNASGGKFAGGFEFDGVDDYMTFSTNNISDSQGTISFWVKPDTDSSGSKYWMRIGSSTSNRILFAENIVRVTGATGTEEPTITSFTKPTQDAWNFMTVSWNSNTVDGTNTLVYYLNGAKDAWASTGFGSWTVAAIGYLGSNLGTDMYFNGTIDEVAIYNRSLNATEIYAHYLMGNATRAGINTSNWTSPVIDSGEQGNVNWTYIEWDTAGDSDGSRANITRTSELTYDDSMVLWMHFNNESPHECYDNKTEILTDEGWKYFKDLTKNEKVATLNPETKETEFNKPYRYQTYEHNDYMYRIETEDGDLLVSPEHKVYAGIKENKLQPLLINPIVVIKVLEDDNTFFKSENQDKTSNADSLELTQVMPEVLEMLNSSNIRVYNLLNLLSDSNCKGPIFSPEFIENLFQTRKDIKWKTHFRPNNLSNSSKVIRECGSFSIFFNFSRYSSLTSIQSIGSQPILSQNSWSSSESVPVLINSSKIFFLFNSSLFTSDQFTQEKCSISDLSCLSSENVKLAIYITPLLTNCSNFFNCSTLLLSPSLATSTQFTWGSLSNFSFNSSGIDNVILSIFLPPSDYFYTSNNLDIYKSFDSEVNLNNFSLQPISEVYGNFDNKEIYFLNKDKKPIKVSLIKKEKYSGKIYDVTVDNHIILVRRKNDEVGSKQVTNTAGALGDENCKENGCGKDGKGSDGGNEGGLGVLEGGVPSDKNGELNEYLIVWSGNSYNASCTNCTPNDVVYDYSSAENNGTIEGNITYNVSGRFDGAFEFDGVDDYVSVDALVSDISSDNVGTAELWVNFNSGASGDSGNIFSLSEGTTTNNYFQINVHNSPANSLRFRLQDSGELTTKITTNTYADAWHHVAVTSDGSTTKFYVDGTEPALDTDTDSGNWLNDLPSLTYGRIGGLYYDSGETSFNGTIDEVAIYNRSLSAEEIRNHYYEDVVRFQTRSGNASTPDTTWTNWSNVPIDGTARQSITADDRGNRFLQYRTVLTSNTTATPVLEEVRLNYSVTTGKPGGGTWADTASDKRLKKNIKESKGALKRITSISGKEWDWINPEERGPAGKGFVADDIEEVYPEAVIKVKPKGKDAELVGENETIKTYYLPNSFFADMVDAIGELNSKVEELESGNITIVKTVIINQTTIPIANQTTINQSYINQTFINTTRPLNITIPALNQTAITEMQLKMDEMETKNTQLENRIAVLESMLEQANGTVIIKFG